MKRNLYGIDKLSAVMVREALKAPALYRLNIGKRKGRSIISEARFLILDAAGAPVTLSAPWTYDDRIIYNAVATLYAAGDRVITPAAVYRAMTGGGRVTKAQAARVMESIEKARRIRAQMELQNAAAAGYKIRGGKLTFDAYLLSATGITYSNGAHTVRAYRLDAPPVLMEYAAALGQVAAIPAGMLKIQRHGRPVHYSGRRLRAVWYLAARVAIMAANREKTSRAIRVSSLLEACGVEGAGQDAQKKTRRAAAEALEYWKSAGFIDDFQPVKEGRQVTGFIVTCKPANDRT